MYWGLILGRGFVPVPPSFAVKSLGLGVRELKTRTKNALSSHIKVGRFVYKKLFAIIFKVLINR